jgi:predicted nucleic acid-binding Zn ribbon protein
MRSAAPRTPLAVVQVVWAKAVGECLASVAVPVSERDRTITVACANAVSAQELDLMQETFLERLRDEVGDQAPQALRFRVDSARF